MQGFFQDFAQGEGGERRKGGRGGISKAAITHIIVHFHSTMQSMGLVFFYSNVL